MAEFSMQAMVMRSATYHCIHVKQPRVITWIPPPGMCISLNYDGAKKTDSQGAGIGSLLRANEGLWLGGCCRHIGVCSSLQVELWALADSLKLAWAMGFRDVMV